VFRVLWLKDKGTLEHDDETMPANVQIDSNDDEERESDMFMRTVDNISDVNGKTLIENHPNDSQVLVETKMPLSIDGRKAINNGASTQPHSVSDNALMNNIATIPTGAIRADPREPGKQVVEKTAADCAGDLNASSTAEFETLAQIDPSFINSNYVPFTNEG
jgi:hypothetical protein